MILNHLELLPLKIFCGMVFQNNWDEFHKSLNSPYNNKNFLVGFEVSLLNSSMTPVLSINNPSLLKQIFSFMWLKIGIANWHDWNTFNGRYVVDVPKTSQLTKVVTQRPYSKATLLAQKLNFASDSKGSAQPSKELQSLSASIVQPKHHENVHSTTLKPKVRGPSRLWLRCLYISGWFSLFKYVYIWHIFLQLTDFNLNSRYDTLLNATFYEFASYKVYSFHV